MEKRKLFLNISNHPAKGWEESQRSEALAIVGAEGAIVDVPFPAVDPARLDRGYLEQLACEVLKAIDQLDGQVTHAMVQGEHTLTFLLVKRLQERGVRCYAATTERIVETVASGAKLSRFVFCGFREYPSLSSDD